LVWDEEAAENWRIACGRCGGDKFIHGAEWERRKAEAAEVLLGLPREIAAKLK
jgi:hypothetical protein